MLDEQNIDRAVSVYKIGWSKHRIKWRHLGCAMVLMMSMMFGLWPGMSSPEVVASADCRDVDFIFIRGSGEVLDEKSEKGRSYVAWKTSILDEIKDLDVTTKFYNLGTETHGGYQYPAAAVSGNLQGYWNLVTAYFSAGTAADFGESVKRGQGELINYMSEEMKQCPDTKFVLGGYSQGAMILSKTLNKLYAPSIIYVATFGDPKIYLPEGKSEGWGVFETTSACRGGNLSPYREYVPDCHAYTGVLGAVNPYQPDAYMGKLGTWCNEMDIMCSSGMNIDDHTAYVKEGLYASAAKVIKRKLQAAFPEKIITTPEQEAEKANVHNLVFLFDVTGSMISWANLYRDEMLYLTQEINDKGGAVAFYTYADIMGGDNGNAVPPQEKCNLGCSAEGLNGILSTLQTEGGGDEPESLLSGASFAMKMATWMNGATKSIVVLTSSGYHPVDGDGTTLEKVVQQSLAIDPVNFYILTLKDIMPEYVELAEATSGGVYEIKSKNNASNFRAMTNAILYRPVVKLDAAEYAGAKDRVFRFDASDSYGFGEEPLRYEWDLDGDGIFELKNVGSIVQKVYQTEFTGYIQVRVSDERGRSTMSAKVKVEDQEEIKLPEIKNLAAKEDGNSKHEISFETDAEQILLVVNDTVLGFVEFADGKGEVIIEDGFDNTEVSLVPYRNARRGLTASILLQETDVDDEENVNDKDDKDGEDGDAVVEESDSVDNQEKVSDKNKEDLSSDKKTPSSSKNNGVAGVNSEHSLDMSATLPKVPDTGAYSKKK